VSNGKNARIIIFLVQYIIIISFVMVKNYKLYVITEHSWSGHVLAYSGRVQNMLINT